MKFSFWWRMRRDSRVIATGERSEWAMEKVSFYERTDASRRGLLRLARPLAKLGVAPARPLLGRQAVIQSGRRGRSAPHLGCWLCRLRRFVRPRLLCFLEGLAILVGVVEDF